MAMRTFGLALTLMAGLTPPLARAAAPSLDAYGALPSVSDVEMSPDGAEIALLVGDGAGRQLQIRATASHKLVYGESIGVAKVRGLRWAGPRHLLVLFSSATQPFDILGPKREYLQVADLNLDKRKLHPLINNMDRTLNTIVAPPMVRMVKGHPVVFAESLYFPMSMGMHAVYESQLDSGLEDRILEGDENTERFLVDAQGAPLARADYNQRDGRWTLLADHNGAWSRVYGETGLIEHPELEGLGRDGQSIVIQTPAKEGWRLQELSLKDGVLSESFPRLPDAEPIFDPTSHALIGGWASDGFGAHYSFISPADQTAWDGLLKAFPGELVELASWSDDRKQVVVKVEGPRDGAGFFVVDLNAHTAGWLADEYAAIGPEAVAEKKQIHYAAADGLEIPAYLTLPKGRPATNLPVIVLVHGGPAANDALGFDWWSQALASRGYAVLQPQYRGSAGFGEAHLEAGFGQWGRKMQTDLSDGVRALARQGVIDPKRVCIMGGSYGGYAALAGAAFDPGVYRCAVSLAGPADLRGMLAYERALANGGKTRVLRYWDRFMGAASPTDPALDAISPALHADKVTIPVLLIHGQDDTVVQYEQSQEMAQALKRAGKPVELVTLKSEDHWLSRSESRMQMLKAAVAFVEAHNPADPPSIAPAQTAASSPAGAAR
jgi:dipeptidyl aminopeptidase/acylaminoacyl peptidase